MTAAYVAAVLTLYLDLPDTPLRPSRLDQSLARKLYDQAVPLPLVETALFLATLRRLSRPSDLAQPPKIRSLSYFLPVIEELQQQPPTATSTTSAFADIRVSNVTGVIYFGRQALAEPAHDQVEQLVLRLLAPGPPLLEAYRDVAQLICHAAIPNCAE